MKSKVIVSIVLLAFVAICVVVLLVKELQPAPTPAMAANQSTSAATAPGSQPAVADPAAAVPAVDGAAGTTALPGTEAKKKDPPKHQVQAFYFHNNTRCPSCLKIEKYTTRAIKEGFPDELKSGALTFQVINTDDKGNGHYNDDYQLVTKSVIISDRHKGEETRFKNLEKVWDLLGDEEEFVKYIQDEVTAYLDESE